MNTNKPKQTRFFLLLISFFMLSLNSVNAQYCTPTKLGPNNSFYISNVQLETINNTSNNSTSKYTYYQPSTTTSTILQTGKTYILEVEYHLISSYDIGGLTVWIDYNSNQKFSNGNEKIFQGMYTPFGVSSNATEQITFTVPTNATLGITRLRLGLRQNGYSNSCDNSWQSGEFEDYDIVIVDEPIDQTDTDSDGVINSIDLDDDNDGILDTLEQMGDVNRDDDNDSVPNHLDLDSDNDGIFDTYEYDAKGDVDITGNGIGNGDVNSDGILLSIQSFPTPIDTDNDGFPNFIDLDSDGYGTYDIEKTIYTELVSHTNGKIDGSDDNDNDGILDPFDTDTSTFGSPRNLDNSYALFFDGRNDYVEEAKIFNGAFNATLMAWVKIDQNSSNKNRVIVGQKHFYLQVKKDGKLMSVAKNTKETKVLTGSILPTETWVHVATSYNTNTSKYKLFINGVEVSKKSIGNHKIKPDNSKFNIGRKYNKKDYFKGAIDEVRVFNKGLSANEIKQIVYQELDELNNFNSGKIIGKEVSPTLGTSLVRYYKMDGYKDNILDDKTTPSLDTSGAKIYNVQEVQRQTAPLPFYSIKDGNWSDKSTWLFGNYIGTPEENNPNSASIVIVNHTISVSNTIGVLGLEVDTNAKLNVENNSGLFISSALNLNGIINLDGESQLIQTANSEIDPDSEGYIEKDEQGTANAFTYNYWASPVSKINVGSNNVPFNISDVLRDGSDPTNPKVINFGGSAYYADNSLTSPIKLSTYWLYKFINTGNNYANWSHVGNSENLNVTDGFTMKGTSGVSAVSDWQNYVFVGKPNNAPDGKELVHTTFAANNGTDGNISLTGNPFPSALDADAFIYDNLTNGTNSITGTLYFWIHYGGGNHNSKDYDGGYATYVIGGGVPAPYLIGGLQNKTPQQYISVGQGFFVSASETGGDVVFKNSQRVFETKTDILEIGVLRTENESSQENNSISSSDVQKIRLGFNTSHGFHRQILVSYISGATDIIDPGYDAVAFDNLRTDMLLGFEDEKYVILSYGEFNEEREIPLTINIDKREANDVQTIKIDDLENIDETVGIFIKDNETNVVHDLRVSDFEFQLEAGEYQNKYSIVFKNQVLQIPDDELSASNLVIRMNNSTSEIQIFNNENLEINKVSLFNILGQQIKEWDLESSNSIIYLPIENQSTGVYIVNTRIGPEEVSTKIIVE